MRTISLKTLLAALVAAPMAKIFATAFSTPITHTSTTNSASRMIIHKHQMTLSDMSDLYANFPLQSAILTCGVKAHVADGIAQVRSETDRLEFRRNLAYVLYGGIFVGGMCHLEYDYIFPALFGNDHSITTIFEEVIFDNFISAPLFWLPPCYLIKSAVYDYPMKEGLEKYVHDIKHNGLLTKYLSIWIPAQSISFSVIPGELHPAFIFVRLVLCTIDSILISSSFTSFYKTPTEHLRIVFMASVSFFWFILFSTVASGEANENNESSA